MNIVVPDIEFHARQLLVVIELQSREIWRPTNNMLSPVSGAGETSPEAVVGKDAHKWGSCTGKLIFQNWSKRASWQERELQREKIRSLGHINVIAAFIEERS